MDGGEQGLVFKKQKNDCKVKFGIIYKNHSELL